MTTIRLCEWSQVKVLPREWSHEKRQALLDAANAWREKHRLNALPLEWSGADGCTLRARQWVGMVEVAGARVEIYPKTDATMLSKNVLGNNEAQFALFTLLRVLDAARYSDWIESELAALQSAPLTFVDVWAYLFARNLWPQLRQGLPHAYLPREDNFPVVRGRILLSRQLAHYGERADRLLCEWDEFSPDTALLRLLKCACRILRSRVTHPTTMGLLGDCLFVLDEVQDITPDLALRKAKSMVWTRATERFKNAFNLASRILQELGPQLGSGDETTWTFLVDMNRVFEAFCRAALESRFDVVVQEQQNIGWLFQQPHLLQQRPDYQWRYNGQRWIGDAKWKLLGGKFSENDDKFALSPDDARQLITYCELDYARRLNAGDVKPKRAQLAIFYPDLHSNAQIRTYQTWNGTTLCLVPVQMTGWRFPGEALPSQFNENSTSR